MKFWDLLNRWTLLILIESTIFVLIPFLIKSFNFTMRRFFLATWLILISTSVGFAAQSTKQNKTKETATSSIPKKGEQSNGKESNESKKSSSKAKNKPVKEKNKKNSKKNCEGCVEGEPCEGCEPQLTNRRLGLPTTKRMCISEEAVEDEMSFLPLSFVFGYHFNAFWKKPESDKNKAKDNKTTALGFWGSRQISAALYYDLQLGGSGFFVSPGIGLSFDSYRFKNNFVPVRVGYDDPTTTTPKEGRFVFMEKASKVVKPFPEKEAKKNSKDKNKKEESLADKQKKAINYSALYTRYADLLMLELRWYKKAKNYKKAFFIAVGGKLGVLWKSKIKVSYDEDKETKKYRITDSFQLSNIKYGVYARMGLGRYGICYQHTLSNLVKQKKWRGKMDVRPWSIGLSIDIF